MTNNPQDQPLHLRGSRPEVTSLSPWVRWQDWVRLGLGLWLLLATVVLPSSQAYSLATWIGGPLLVLAALWTLARPTSRESVWASVIIASMLITFPSLLGYAANMTGAWNVYFTNLTMLALCVWSLDEIRRAREVHA